MGLLVWYCQFRKSISVYQ